MTDENGSSQHFIAQIVRDDLASGRHTAIRTRFPPEPNGFLHLGHAKAICLDFGLAAEYNGVCNLRLDDTNPGKEDPVYAQSIKDDLAWLGFEWAELRHASDYFEVFYRGALKLIADGKAYVDDLDAEQLHEYRGTLTESGRNSPHRDRSVVESTDLFQRMRAGEFADGSKTLRARIDMAAGNINMRDPALYRIRKMAHQMTGDAWPIYPMYDYAHSLSDAVEGITHSFCTLEFEDHRPLYDWCVDNVDLVGHPELLESLVEAGLPAAPSKPRQIEFSRGNLDYTVMSKRKLLKLVEDNLVDGWDDPRMPTLVGARRRGFTAKAIRTFWERAGISKQNSIIEFGVLEGCVREDLDAHAPRRMGVLEPLKLILDNLPENHEEAITLPNHPKDESFGTRQVSMGRELWMEHDDFAEVPPKGFKRLRPEGEVRLRGIGIIQHVATDKDADGNITAIHATLDPDSRHGMEGANRKIKGTIHWVSGKHAIEAEVRLYDRLFDVPAPEDGQYISHLNPDSRRVISAQVEPAAADSEPEQHLQFERTGYFVTDRFDHSPDKPVFNRAVSLRDTWAKRQK